MEVDIILFAAGPTLLLNANITVYYYIRRELKTAKSLKIEPLLLTPRLLCVTMSALLRCVRPVSACLGNLQQRRETHVDMTGQQDHFSESSFLHQRSRSKRSDSVLTTDMQRLIHAYSCRLCSRALPPRIKVVQAHTSGQF